MVVVAGGCVPGSGATGLPSRGAAWAARQAGPGAPRRQPPTCAEGGGVQLRAAARQLPPQLVRGLGVAHAAPPPLPPQRRDEAAVGDNVGRPPARLHVAERIHRRIQVAGLLVGWGGEVTVESRGAGGLGAAACRHRPSSACSAPACPPAADQLCMPQPPAPHTLSARVMRAWYVLYCRLYPAGVVAAYARHASWNRRRPHRAAGAGGMARGHGTARRW